MTASPRVPMLSVNGRFLTQSLTGVQRYALETARALQALAAEQAGPARIEVLAPPGAAQPDGVVQRAVGRIGGHLWEQCVLPMHARGRLLNFCNTYPLLARRQLVVVHDASVYAAPEGYTANFVRYYRFLIGELSRRRNTIVVTDSEFSRSELARHAGFDPARIRVVPCGVDHWCRVTPDETVLDRLALRGSRFLLAVASHNPNKNLARLVSAFARIEEPDCRLVLVGGGNARVFARGEEADDPRVVRTGRIDDAELSALYCAALAFVFPSRYEGFGLPPLEAMSFGCPVLVSRAASLPEVCGDAASYFDPLSVDDMVRAIREFLTNPDLARSLSARGRVQASGFTWRRTASQLLALLDETHGQ